MVDGLNPVAQGQGLALVVGDRHQRIGGPAAVGLGKILQVLPPVEGGDGLARHIVEQGKMQQINVEMDHIELRQPPTDLAELKQMGRQVAPKRIGVEPDRLIAHRHQRRLGRRIRASKERHIMAKIDQRVAQKGDDALRSPIKPRRHRLIERGDLCDFHSGASSESRRRKGPAPRCAGLGIAPPTP